MVKVADMAPGLINRSSGSSSRQTGLVERLVVLRCPRMNKGFQQEMARFD